MRECNVSAGFASIIGRVNKLKRPKKTENPLLNIPIMHESPLCCCDVRFTCVPSFHLRRRLLCREQWSHGLQLILLHVPR